MRPLAWLLPIAATALGAQQPRREVAVTFDDLPMNTRAYAADVGEQERMTTKLLAAIVRHRVPAVGFVNEGKLAPGGAVEDRRVDLLRRWVAAGLELGNHSYSHGDLHTTDVSVFEQDVARGDSVTRILLQAAKREAPRWFRHPFLHTGRDTAVRHHLERFLTMRGYRVAPVTIDNNEYIFAAAYDRLSASRDTANAQRVARDYLDYMAAMFAYYERQSVAIASREIRQVLLLHANRLNADHFGALAGLLERRGYTFISLDRALEDPAYRFADEYTGPAGITWLHRWALTQGKRGAFFAGEPTVPKYVQKLAAIEP